MPIKPIVKMGNKQLATPSVAVAEFGTRELKTLVQDMHDTMVEMHGVGIAAPQIGCYLRVIMFGFEKNSRYPNEEPVPFTVLINPVIEISSDEMIDGWEGCLSVPKFRGVVPRFNKIKYSGFDVEGLPIVREARGFHARIVQHECDHIDGILFPQRMTDMTTFAFEDELFKN